MLFVWIGIAQANLVSVLVLTVLPVAVSLWRIRVEEAAMAAGWGIATARCRLPARLVPWL